MAEKIQVGAVVSLDGEKEFQLAVSGCSKEITKLKAEAGKLKEEYIGQANTLEALTKKQAKLLEIVAKHKEKQEELRKAHKHALEDQKRVKEEISDLKNEYADISNKIEVMKKSTDTATDELKAHEDALAELSKNIEKSEENYKRAEVRVKSWEAKIKTAEAQTAKATNALKQNGIYLMEAEKSTDKCAKSIDGFGNKVKEVIETTLDWKEVLKAGFAENITGVLVDGVRELGDSTLETATNMVSAAHQMQASTGMARNTVYEYQNVMKDVYGNNYGDNFEDVGEAVSTVVQNLGELDPTQLQKTTESAITLRDTFGFEYQEQIRAVQMLMDSFGVSSKEAYNLIAQGAQNGLNKNGDLLDTINEYAVHYKQMGASAEDFFNSLANGTASGTFSVDKLGDAYKEFGIRVKDTAESTTEGYNLLGLNADEMRAKFAAGGESAKSATAIVLSALFSMNDQVKQNQAGVDLFGTMWEDLGAQGVEALMNLNGEISSTKNVMAEIQSIKYDDLTNQLTQITRLIQMEFAEPLAEKYLPKVKDGLEVVADNIDVVKTGIYGLGTIGMVSMASKTKSIAKLVGVMSKITSVTEGATVAQIALNAAQSMSPAGWLMLIIAGVTASVIAYKNATKDTITEEKKRQQEINRLCDATDKLTESMTENRKSRQEAKQDMDAEYGAYQKMSDELFELAEKEKKSNEEKAYMKSLVDELNEKLPELNLQYDEQTDLLNKSKEAVNDYIKSLERKALVQAAEEDLTSIMKERYEAERNIYELEKERNSLVEKRVQANSKVAAAEKEHYRLLAEGEVSDYDPKEMAEYASVAGECDVQITQLNEKIVEQKDALAASDEELETVKGILGEYKTVTDEAADATGELAGSQKDATAQTVQMTQEQIEAYNELKKAIESSVDSAISAFDKFDGGTEISTGKVLENLTSQVDGISKWSDNLKTLAGAAGEGMTKEFYDYLVDLGPSSANLVQSLVNSLENNTEDFSNVCIKWTEAMNLEDTVSESLAQTSVALESGMQEAFKTVEKEGTQAGEQTGTVTTEAIAEGTEAAKEEVVSATKIVLTQANSNASAMRSDFQTTGSYLMDGMKFGILTKSSEIGVAVASAIRHALEAGKREADIHSPSRKFKKEIGEQIGKGMAFGIKDTAKLSEEEAAKMSAKVFSAAKAWLKKYKKSKETSLDDEIYYWKQVRKELKKGTDAYEKASKKIDTLKKEKTDIQNYHLSGGALDAYKTYYNVSLQAEIDYWNKVRNQYTLGTAERLEADQKYYEAKESYNEQLVELNQEYYDNCKEVNERLADEVQELTDAYADAVSERADAIYSSFGLFDQFESTSKSGSTLLYNLKTQVAGFADWQLQIEELANRGISKGLLEELKEMGPEASASLHALNSLTEEQLREYDSLWQQKKALSQSQALKDTENLKAETEAKIQAAKEAAQKELDAYTATYKEAMASLSTTMEAPLSELADKATKWGETSVLSFINSVKNRASNKSTSVELKTATDTISSQLGVLKDSGTKIGKDTLQGILDGLTNKKKITSSARQMVEMLKQALKDEADIHSPSRLFKREIGEQLSAGVAEGVMDNSKKVNYAGEDMIKSLIEKSKEQLRISQAELSGYLQSIQSSSGIAALNNLISVAPVQQVNATVDNSDLIAMFGNLLAVMQNGFTQLGEMQVVLDSGELVGSTSMAMGNELAMQNRRRR